MKLKLNIKNRQKRVNFNQGTVKKIILAALKSKKAKKPAEFDLLFTGDKEIKELNLLYLGENCPTDVIAFDVSIAISADTAARNAKIYRTSPVYELYLYVTHGILHILGYDDNTKIKQRIMQAKAEKILKCLSIKPKP